MRRNIKHLYVLSFLFICFTLFGLSYIVSAQGIVLKDQPACDTCKSEYCEKHALDEPDCTPTDAADGCKTECATTEKKAEDKPSEGGTITPEGDQTVMGITMGPKCLKNGQCSFKIYDLLGLKQDMPAESRVSGTFFVQDILLAATFFIGTIITIALIWSGVMYILAGATGKDPANAKNGITYSVIGLVLVISSYAIIRLVQYIAKGF